MLYRVGKGASQLYCCESFSRNIYKLEGKTSHNLIIVCDYWRFAAEIFHDLHEEVTATAARGHNLMIRVQQLEAEVPSIEKAFLSQTDLSSFYYNAG